MFENAIKALSCCTKDGGKLILSLPNHYVKWNLRVNVPKFPKANVQILSPRLFQNEWDIKKDGNGEHYWEIGAKGSSEKTILSILNKYFDVEKRFLPDNNMYHMFFVLRSTRRR